MSLFAGFWEFLDNNCAMNGFLFWGLVVVLLVLIGAYFVLKNKKQRDDDD